MAKLKAKDPKQAKLRKPRIAAFGAAGVGKTWVVIDYPDVYYIDSEGGATLPHYTDKLKAVNAGYLGPEDGANDMDFVVDQVRALATTKHRYKTLVIDSYSKLFNTSIQVEYDRLAATRDMTKSYGAEKKPAIAKTRQIIRWLERVDINVILVCHEKTLWKDNEPIGEIYDGWDKLAYELDLTMQIIKTGKTRKARICKSRLSQFSEGELIDWSYQAFAERYGKDILEAEVTQFESCTPKQVQAVTQLAADIELNETVKLQWFEKAGVESWEQMDKTTLSKCIDYLKNLKPQDSIQ